MLEDLLATKTTATAAARTTTTLYSAQLVGPTVQLKQPENGEIKAERSVLFLAFIIDAAAGPQEE